MCYWKKRSNFFKKEGDGATPIGIWPFRDLYYRKDRLQCPVTGLNTITIKHNMGWSDDPTCPDYNKLIKLPYNGSHEVLWRYDEIYNIIIPLGYNDTPAISGLGSAIFVHIARVDYSGTEGCIALSQPDLLALAKILQPGDTLKICE